MYSLIDYMLTVHLYNYYTFLYMSLNISRLDKLLTYEPIQFLT
jgi:hypothetical protein